MAKNYVPDPYDTYLPDPYSSGTADAVKASHQQLDRATSKRKEDEAAAAKAEAERQAAEAKAAEDSKITSQISKAVSQGISRFSGNGSVVDGMDGVATPANPEASAALERVIPAVGDQRIAENTVAESTGGAPVRADYVAKQQQTINSLPADLQEKATQGDGALADVNRQVQGTIENPTAPAIAQTLDKTLAGQDDSTRAQAYGTEAINAQAQPAMPTEEDGAFRKEFAKDNHITGALISGAAGLEGGLLDSVPLAVDAINNIINPYIKLAGGDGLGPAPRLPGAEFLEKIQNGYRPPITDKSWSSLKGYEEKTDWLATQAALQAPQLAGGLGAAVLPKIRSLYLGAMGAMSAGQQYQQDKEAGIEHQAAAADAFVNGGLEILTEMLPLHVFDKIKSAIPSMGLAARAGLIGSVLEKSGIAAAAFAGQTLPEAGSEAVAQLGQNASQKYIAGDDRVKDITDGVPEAAIIGGLLGAPTGAVHIYNAATDNTPQAIQSINYTLNTDQHTKLTDEQLTSMRDTAAQINSAQAAPSNTNTVDLAKIDAEIQRRANLGTLTRSAEEAARTTQATKAAVPDTRPETGAAVATETSAVSAAAPVAAPVGTISAAAAEAATGASPITQQAEPVQVVHPETGQVGTATPNSITGELDDIVLPEETQAAAEQSAPRKFDTDLAAIETGANNDPYNQVDRNELESHNQQRAQQGLGPVSAADYYQQSGKQGYELVDAPESSVSLPTTTRLGVQLLAKAFGKKVRYIEDRNGKDLFFSGVYGGSIGADENTIFLDAKGGVSLTRVVGHEIGHALRTQAPDLYDILEAEVLPMLNQDTAVKDLASRGYGSPEKLSSDINHPGSLSREEAIADLIGDKMTSPKFWADMAAKMTTAKAQEFFARTFKVLDKALKAIRSAPLSGQDKQVVKAAHSAIVEAMAAYRQRIANGEIKGATSDSSNEYIAEPYQEAGQVQYAKKQVREKVGQFEATADKSGALTVYGDPEAIRAALPPTAKGRVTKDGVVFTSTASPGVRAALEGRKNVNSRAGEIQAKKAMKDGKLLGAPDKFNSPLKLPRLRKILKDLANEGAPGRFWYENSSKEILRMVGGDVNEARKFVALLAIYSPQAKVDANTTFALRAWAQYKAGQPISVKTAVMDKKAKDALDSIDDYWSGEKTGNFFNNLLREIDPSTSETQGATIDMWMMRAGQYSTDAPTATQYAFMEDETNRLAKDLGWEPQQVQAAIWVAMKARMENKGVKERTEASSEKKGWIRFERDEKGKRRVILDAQKHRDNWLREAFAHDPSKEDTKQAKFDFSDGVLRHIGQVSFEARPGRTSGVLPGIHEAPYEQQVEFQQAVQKALYDENGNDLLAMRLGLLVDNDLLAPGVWQGEVSPSSQKSIAMAPAKGDDGKTSVDPAQAKALNTYAAMLGLLTKQEGVGWHRPFYKGNKSGENGLDIDIGRTVTPDEAKAVEAAVDKWMLDNGKGKDWVNSFAFISSPTGIRLVNFGVISNTQLRTDILSALDGTLPDGNAVAFSSDGDMPTNNWKENPDGQDYIQRISTEGSSDLLGWGRDFLAPRVQKVFNEFSDKYDWGNPGQIRFSRKSKPEEQGYQAPLNSLVLNPDGKATASSNMMWGGVSKDRNLAPIDVVKLPDGRLYVLNGYHRVAHARIDKKESIAVQEIELSPEILDRVNREMPGLIFNPEIKFSRKPTSQLVMINEIAKNKAGWGKHLDRKHIAKQDRETKDLGQSLNTAYLDAAKQKDAFDAFIRDLAEGAGVSFMVAPLKGRSRAVEKIVDDYNGNADKIKDLLRATISTESLAQARQIHQALAQLVPLANVAGNNKSDLDPSKPSNNSGYRDAKLILDINGVPAEVIIAPEAMLRAKELGHAIYDKSRSLPAAIMAAQTAGDSKRLAKLMADKASLDAKMVEVYAPAFERANSSRASLRVTGTPFSAMVRKLMGRLTGSNTQKPDLSSTAKEPSKSKNLASDPNSSNASAMVTTSESSIIPQGKGVRFSRKAFEPSEFEGFAPALEKAKAAAGLTNETERRQAIAAVIPVTKTPEVFNLVKALRKNDYVIGTASTIYLKGANQHTHSSHNAEIPMDVLAHLPQLLADPIAIYDKGAFDKANPKANSSEPMYLVVLPVKVKGEYVTVAIAPESRFGKATVSFIKSVHTRAAKTLNAYSKQMVYEGISGRNEEDLRMMLGTMPRVLRSGVPLESGTDLTIRPSKGIDKVKSRGDIKFSRKQIDTPEFKKWFGDSKVVDAEGKPLVVYHGTKEKFTAFDPLKQTSETRLSQQGAGFYFTNNKAEASGYGKPIETFIKIENPLNLNRRENQISKEQAVEILSKGNYGYFTSDWIPFSLGLDKNASLSKEELIDRYVENLNPSEPGFDKKFLKDFKRAYKPYGDDNGFGLMLDVFKKVSGFDGVIEKISDKTTVYTVLTPSAIKSATGNNGDFDSSNNDIRFKRKPANQTGSTLALPDETTGEAAIRTWQNDQIRWKNQLEKIREKGGVVNDQNDVYQAMERMVARSMYRTEDFFDKHVTPVLTQMRDADITIDEIGDYLYAMHAKERNAEMKKINPQFAKAGYTDVGGSGMSDQEADQIIAAVQRSPKAADMDRFAQAFRSWTDSNLASLVQGGLMSQEQADILKAKYPNYVPLKGYADGSEVDGIFGSGSGFSTGKKLFQRALGRKSKANNPAVYIIHSVAEGMLAREKANVGRYLERLIKENPDDKLWTIGKPDKDQVLGKTPIRYEIVFNGVPGGSFQYKAQADQFIKLMNLKGATVQKSGGEDVVTERDKGFDKDREIRFIRDGKEVRIQLKDPLLVRSYNNQGMEQMHSLLKVSAAINSFLRQMWTQKNPVFPIVNVVRDIPSSILYATGEKGFTFATDMARFYPQAFKAAWQLAGKKPVTGAMTKLIKEYRAAGGGIGFRMISDTESTINQINALQARLGQRTIMQAIINGEIKQAGKRLLWRTYNNAVIDLIERINATFENMSRIAIFSAARERGMSAAEAARMSKNVTVNFNRRGEQGPNANSLYLFMNASVQGLAKDARSIGKAPNKNQARAVLATYVGLGFAIAALAGGDDDDDLTQENANVTSIRIKFGDAQTNIPLPYGSLGFSYYLGRSIYKMMSGDAKVAEQTMRLASAMLSHMSPINPVPNADDPTMADVAVAAVPTAFELPAMVVLNRTSFGGAMRPDYSANQPDAYKAFRGTRNSVYSELAAFMNESTGGTTRESGMVDVSPETLKGMVHYALGGTGKFVGDAASTGSDLLSGEVEVNKIPLVNRFIKMEDVTTYRARFYNEAGEAKDKLALLNGYRKDRNQEKLKELLPWQQLGRRGNSLWDKMNALRDQEALINSDDKLTSEVKLAKLKDLEAQQIKISEEYHSMYKEKAPQD